jgi:phospholipid/cholesterol/gamma-HCH transport system substrate-binding protein
MDQLKSNSDKSVQADKSKPEAKKHGLESMPKRGFSLEMMVGVFTIVGVAALGYLAVGLGELRLYSGNEYALYAEFDNVSGLKPGATVEVAGVQVGSVTGLELNDPSAKVTMMLRNDFKVKDDDIAMIRTKGIIGDRYVKISRGASESYLEEGATISDTESVVDLEDVIGKLVHNMTSDKEEDKENKEEKKS